MSLQLKLCPGCGRHPIYKDDMGICEACGFSAPVVQWQTRTPGPATKAMLEYARWIMRYPVAINAGDQRFRDFLAEWNWPLYENAQ